MPSYRFRHCPLFPALVLAFSLGGWAVAHPIPDIPVRASFNADGTCQIQVEVDPRCFEADPNTSPSVLYGEFQKNVSGEQRDAWKAKAKEFLQRTVQFLFEPQGPFQPEFAFEFTKQEGEPLKNADDIVVLSGAWHTRLPEGMKGYRLHAIEGGKLCVLFINTLHGQAVRRIAVLFPGESSYLLDPAGPPPAPSEDDIVASEEGDMGSNTLIRFGVPGAIALVALGFWWARQRNGRRKAAA